MIVLKAGENGELSRDQSGSGAIKVGHSIEEDEDVAQRVDKKSDE